MKIVGLVLGGIALVAFALFLGGLILAVPLMFLWNWLIPDLFNLPEIGYLQAFGLFYLSGLLFRSVPTSEKKN